MHGRKTILRPPGHSIQRLRISAGPFEFICCTDDLYFSLFCSFQLKTLLILILVVKEWLLVCGPFTGEIDNGGSRGSVNNRSSAIMQVYALIMRVKVAKIHKKPFIFHMVQGFACCIQIDQLSLQNLRYLLLICGQIFEKKHY